MNAIKIARFLIQYKFTIVTVLYLLVITYLQNPWRPIVSAESFAYLNTLTLILYLHLFGRSRFRIFFLLLFSILLTYDSYYGIFFNSNVTMGIVAAIFEATVADMKSVLKTFLPSIILLFSIMTSLVFLSANELSKLKIRRKYSALLLAVYLLVCIPFILFLKINYRPNNRTLFKDKPILWIQYSVGNHFPLVYSSLTTIVGYYSEMHSFKSYTHQKRTLPDGITISQQNNLPQKIYFVMGEAQWSNHMSIYGYHLKTTPFLDSLYQTSDHRLTVYHDVFAPASITRDVFRLLLTFATPQQSSPFFTHKNLFEMAYDAGYQTLWITNQDLRGGLHESYAAMIARSSNIYRLNDWMLDRKLPEDLQLIPIVKEYNRPDKQFYFINLMGSHATYSNMYDDIDKEHIPGSGVISDYDRSIHHTDRFMREFYKIIKKDTSSVFVYLSDHGEIPAQSGHGFLGKGSSQFEVPFLIINQSKINIDDLVNKYRIPENNKLNSLSVIYILSELMGYSISDKLLEYVRQQSIFIYHVDGKCYEYKQIEAENETID